MPTLSINHQAISRLRHKVRPDNPTGASDAELARLIGINQSTLGRVLSGKSEPGGKFLGGLLNAFGRRWFNEVIEVEKKN